MRPGHDTTSEANDEHRVVLHPSKYAAIHRSLLSGLLSHVGQRGEGPIYSGARNSKFQIFPGSSQFRRRPQWVMAGEIVETTKLYARNVANIRPEWIESLGPHLVHREYFEPHWQTRTAHVAAYERVSLWGLILAPRRLVHYGPINPVVSRDIFIQHALVDFDLKTAAPFMRHNRALVEAVELLEAKARHRDFIAEPQAIAAFFDSQLPAEIYNGPLLEKWLRDAQRRRPNILMLPREALLKYEPTEISPDRFPDVMTVAGVKLPLRYRFDLAARDDGVTAIVPLAVLSHLPAGAFEWLVPGMLRDKSLALIRSLPKALRTQFIPNADVADAAANAMPWQQGTVLEALASYLGRRSGAIVRPGDFDPKSLPPHLLMNFRVVDESGDVLAEGRDLAEIRQTLSVQVKAALDVLPPSAYHGREVQRWDFGDLPEKVEVDRHGHALPGFPALVEKSNRVELRTLDTAEQAQLANRTGVRRLFMTQIAPELRRVARMLPHIAQISLAYVTFGTSEQLHTDLTMAIADRALRLGDDASVRAKDDFVALAEAGWKRLGEASNEIDDIAFRTLEIVQPLTLKLSETFGVALQPSANDMRRQLRSLVSSGFLSRTPFEWLVHVPRYVRGIQVRLTKLTQSGLSRDVQHLQTISPLQDRLIESQRKGNWSPRQVKSIEQYRWMLEELRVSLFAQELKTSMPISVQRVEKQWEKIIADA